MNTELELCGALLLLKLSNSAMYNHHRTNSFSKLLDGWERSGSIKCYTATF